MLDPCPFCGSRDHIPLPNPSLSTDRQNVIVIVHCNNCQREWKEIYDLRPLRWTQAQPGAISHD